MNSLILPHTLKTLNKPLYKDGVTRIRSLTQAAAPITNLVWPTSVDHFAKWPLPTPWTDSRCYTVRV